jgi:ADP-ribose pyrophosphatase YjhB (NUDIX family)
VTGNLNHSSPKWLAWAQHLQAIAQTGLTYCTDPFDKERYEAISHIAAEIMSTGTEAPVSRVLGVFTAQVGYATPKVDVRAAVFDSEGRILLVREREDSCWTLPGGWADVGSSPVENVLREVFEESGYQATVLKLAAVYDRSRHGHPPIPFYTYKMFFICGLSGGSASCSGIETDSANFFSESELPQLSVTRVTPAQIAHMFDHYRHPDRPTAFD